MSTAGPDNFTVKEIVIDIRDTVKALAEKVDRIDQKSSAASDQVAEQARQLADFDKRMAELERLAERRVTREDLHSVKGEISALKLWQASLTAVATLKRGQLAGALALFGVFAGLIGSVATLIWLHHG